ncbi:hypothetical protein QO004_000345 [Rhizobium mesoamericanum]|uniref:hypothetical protein n=1 Tax=Rhizobium mesoamericanum TaxID=1079800 RepID=UPI002784662B|nr:hypothetical protein [Rhizobium mesoamericanum]MDQ0558572.1 hypothetical protein [Rhizobium mesoamericanum]
MFGAYMANGAKDKLFAFIDRQGAADLNDCASVYFVLDSFPLPFLQERSRTVFAHLAEKIAAKSIDAGLVLGVLTSTAGQTWSAHYRELEKTAKGSIDRAVNRQKARLPRAQRAFAEACVGYMKEPKTKFDEVVATISTRMKPADLQACVRLYLELSQAFEDHAGLRSLDVFYLVSDTALTTGRSTFALEYENRRTDTTSLLHARFEEMGRTGDPQTRGQGHERQETLKKKIKKLIEADAPPPGSRPGEAKLPPLNDNQANFVKLYRAYVDGGTDKQMTAFQNALIKPTGDEIAGFVAVFLQDSAARYRGPPSHRLSQIFFGTLSLAIAKSSSFYAVKVKSYIEANSGLWRQRFDALNASQSEKLQYGGPLRKQIEEKIKNKRLLDDLRVTFWLKYSRDPTLAELRAFDPIEPHPDFDAIDGALVDVDVGVGANKLDYLDKAYSSIAAAIETQADPKARWVLVKRILERTEPTIRFRHLAYLQGVGLIYVACVKTYGTVYWNGFDQAERAFFFEISEGNTNPYYLDFAAQVEGVIAHRGERETRLRDHNYPNWDPGKNDDFYTLMAKAEATLLMCADSMNLRLTPPIAAAALAGGVKEAWDDHKEELEAIRIPIDGRRAGKAQLKVGETIGNIYVLWWDSVHYTAYIQVKGYGQVVFEADPDRLGKIYEDYHIWGKVAEYTEGIGLAIPFMFQILGYLPDLVSGGITGLTRSVLFNLAFEHSMEAMGIDPTKAQLVLLGVSLLHEGFQPKAEEPHPGTVPEPAVSPKAGPTKPVEFYGLDAGHVPVPEAPKLQFYGIELQNPRSTPVPVEIGAGPSASSSPFIDQRTTGATHSGTNNSATAPFITDANRSTKKTPDSVASAPAPGGGFYSPPRMGGPVPYENRDPFPYSAALSGDFEPRAEVNSIHDQRRRKLFGRNSRRLRVDAPGS